MYQDFYATKQNDLFGPWDNVMTMLEDVSRRQDDFYNNSPHEENNLNRVHEAFSQALGGVVENLNNTRQSSEELDPDRPFVLDHGALNGAWNIIVEETDLIGVLDFTHAVYVPYSAAVSDLTNQVPCWEEYNDRKFSLVGYMDTLEWERRIHRPFELRQETLDYYRDREGPGEDEYRPFDRLFNFHGRDILLQRWGEITWEDLVHGDRFNDHEGSDELYSKTPPLVLRNNHRIWTSKTNPKINDGDEYTEILDGFRDCDVDRVLPDARSLERKWVGRHWFYEPVLFLVSQFVESFLNPDELGKWQDPLFAEVFGGTYAGKALLEARKSSQ
jgi:hypothetical protein